MQASTNERSLRSSKILTESYFTHQVLPFGIILKDMKFLFNTDISSFRKFLLTFIFTEPFELHKPFYGFWPPSWIKAFHLERTFKLDGKFRKIVFSSLHCSKFSSKYRVLYIILKLIYHRFYRNNLFLPVALYKTTTDQNVDTTRRNPIHFILGFAVRKAQSRWKFDKIRSFCKRKMGF